MKVVSTKNKVVAIHQPNFIPWIGYFNKIAHADIFIFLDDAQFSKNSFINRNRIKTVQGAQWLTLPVNVRFGQLIREVGFANQTWPKKHLKTIEQNYKKAPAFEEYYPPFKVLIENTQYENISELNISIIEHISKWLELKTDFYHSSKLKVEGMGDDRLISLVKAVNGNVYLSGKGGAKYQNPDKFKKADICLQYYNFVPLQYPQLWGEFIPGLSIIDLLFNCGKESSKIIIQSN